MRYILVDNSFSYLLNPTKCGGIKHMIKYEKYQWYSCKNFRFVFFPYRIKLVIYM